MLRELQNYKKETVNRLLFFLINPGFIEGLRIKAQPKNRSARGGKI